MPYSAQEVANTILHLEDERGLERSSPMKLQKLVYFAHGWYLSLTGQPLISERVQAWDYGPVVESLYHDVKRWGSDPIAKDITEIAVEGDCMIEREPQITDEPTRSFLRQVLNIYGTYSAIQLSNLTHEPGTPWSKVQEKFSNAMTQRSIPIPDELIKSHFDAQRVPQV